MGQGRGWKGGGAPTSRGKRTPGAVPGGGTPGGGGGGGGGGTSSPRNSSPGGVQNPGGGGKGGGGGGSNLPPMPKPWPDNLRKKADLSRDTFKKIGDDVQVVNPRFFDDRPAQINCTRCSAAVEMRAKGFDVKAGLKEESQTDSSIQDIVNKWIDEYGEHRDFTFMSNEVFDVNTNTWRAPTTSEFVKELEDSIRAAGGEGSRGFVRVNWKGKDVGHIFNYEIVDGEIVYIEGQVQYEAWYKGTEWFDRVETRSTLNAVMRVDDLAPSEKLVEDGWIIERTNEEINAPLYKELNTELFRRYDAADPRRQAFRLAWQTIRSGQEPAVPVEYAEIPEMVEAYEYGVVWSRRPD